MQNLVIVESPTKARTLAKFLGDKYQIEASMGHVRDLPKSKLGVDIEHNFMPQYIIPKDKIKRVNELKKTISQAKNIWLATDPDREGEAIAWHLIQLLDEKSPKDQKKANNGRFGSNTNKTARDLSKSVQIKRVTFHEITPQAVQEAFKDPRQIDMQLVDAQQARRVLDRLVGYRLSPLLWKKVKSGLSAGRVQSIALRLIVEREKEIQIFKPVEYWSIETELSKKNDKDRFLASLTSRNGKKIEVKNATEAQSITSELEKSSYKVSTVSKKEVKRYSYPPFTTSTLQQAAALALGMTAKKTMSLAQALYERGLITYMRTDSFNLSPIAISAIRSFIDKNFGKAYLPASAKIYKTKSKSAQEAHEAIRPSNISLKAENLQIEGLSRDHLRLYELIWKRTLACQMAEAVLDATAVDVKASFVNNFYLLRATGSVVKFDGWMKIYDKKVSQTSEEEKNQALPELSENEDLDLLKVLPEQHFTEPPPRYNEASLIKKLEEIGVGRPSTYAPTISTILERFYVERQDRKFVPTELGFAVMDFLLKNFADLFDYSFTAQMENELDEIAQGERIWQPTIASFYQPFEKKVEQTEKVAERVEIESEKVDKKCPECGKELVVKFGRFGKFLACSGYPDCKHTERLENIVEGVVCPDCGGEIVFRKTKKGRPFYGCKNYPTCKYASWTKPGAKTKTKKQS